MSARRNRRSKRKAFVPAGAELVPTQPPGQTIMYGLIVPPPSKQLAVLDLNHVLCLLSTESTQHFAVVGTFLALLFECYHVAVWSTTTFTRGTELVKTIFGEYADDLAFCWFRNTTVAMGEDWDRVKPLTQITAQFPQWTYQNTIIIDDYSNKLRVNRDINSFLLDLVKDDYTLAFENISRRFEQLRYIYSY